MNRKLYTVLHDFDLPPNGIDELEICGETEHTAMAGSEFADLIQSCDAFSIPDGFQVELKFVQQGPLPAECDFLRFGTCFVSNSRAREGLRSVQEIDWIPIHQIRDMPENVYHSTNQPFFGLRFSTMIIPHRTSRIVYYPGTEGIAEIQKLVLASSVFEHFGFRLKGDPLTYYVTHKFMNLVVELGLKGLTFSPVQCEFVK